MSTPNENGNQPALPVTERSYNPNMNQEIVTGQRYGLTKREYFAIHYMAGLAANSVNTGSVEHDAQTAIQAADALLSELSKAP